MAKITLWGMNQWLKDNDNQTIFQELTLPTGIDSDKLLDIVLLQCGEFEVLYANPYFLQDAIKVWGNKHYATLDKWKKALDIEYNPLENYDRKEDWTEITSGTSRSDRQSDTSEENNASSVGSTNSHSDKNANGTSNTNINQANNESHGETQTDQVTAFDSSSFLDKTKKIINGSSDAVSNTVNDATTSSSESGNDSTVNNEVNDSKSAINSKESNTASNTANNIRSGRTHGNIGVTTSQQMLQSELDIAAWNLYKHITDLFQDEFCVAVYY